MNIKKKILLSPLLSVALMLVLGLVSFMGMRSLQNALETITSRSMQHVLLLNESRDDLLEANIGVYRLFSTIGNFDAARIQAETAKIVGHADDAIKILKSLEARSDLGEEERKSLTALDPLLAKYRKSVAQSIDMAQSDLASGTGMMQAADKRFQEAAAQMDTLLASLRQKGQEAVESASSSARRSLTLSMVIFVAAVVATLAVAMVLSNRIVAPLLAAIRTATSIASGNLTNAVPKGGKDETGDLLRALSAMQENLRNLIETIAGNARHALSTSKSMSQTLADINRAVEGQNDATSTVAAAIEQMSVSIGNIHDNATQALHANRDSSGAAKEGGEVIQSAFDEMNRMSGTIREAATVVEQVGQQSNDISAIVQVIREVADQTNLLALNAAIEAARAGEQGRGFAVVADEVRKLAEKTTASAQEIADMIVAIQQSANRAVSDIRHVVEQVSTTASYADQARQSIERIRTSAGQSEGFAGEITSALGEQNKASELIAQKVEGITQTSEANAQGVAQVNQSMRELAERSRQLEEAVTRFTV
ncbi:MAG: methyl-accepting chemotaxis protein [Betaproteobacteria bacterium]|nr:methyl-accepting chemotaxis protein [Betaproteobacteria bacterium]